MRVNIKVTPGLLEALAILERIETDALKMATQKAAERLDREFRAKHFDRRCADYHRTKGL